MIALLTIVGSTTACRAEHLRTPQPSHIQPTQIVVTTDKDTFLINGVIKQLDKSPSVNKDEIAGWSGFNLEISPKVKLTDSSGGDCDDLTTGDLPIYGSNSTLDMKFLQSHINIAGNYQVKIDCSSRNSFEIYDIKNKK